MAVVSARQSIKEAQQRQLPWVEKYRPQNLDELISHKDIVSTIQRFMKEDRLPHLLFYGPPGTGKTSTILACAKTLYSPKEFNSMVLELNASDDRGIGIVRGAILNFASTRTIFKSGFKLIILDEADAMTNDAQNALRRVIEKYTENVRFCMICNYLSKIIPALQSRCTRFRFGPLEPKQMEHRLEHVIKQENVNVQPDGIESLITLSEGDMRRALNILQSTAMAFDEVNEHNVYLCTGQPLPTDIAEIVEWMLNQDFSTAYENISRLKTLKGLALQDIITQIHTYVHRVDFPPKVRMILLDKMATVEYHLSAGTSEKIQLGALLGAFQIVRDIVTTELIREVVDHVLRQPVSAVPAELRSDLTSWKDLEQEKKQKTFHNHDSVEDVSSSISFDLVKRAHKQLEKTPLERGSVYLHELLNGSRLILPTLLPPPRNPELVKRLEKIKCQQEQKEYDKMISNIDNTKQRLEEVRLGLEVQATSRQLWTVFNFLVTVVGAFVFGFCAAGAVGYELPGCVFVGLFIAILVFIADLYFLVKSPTLLDSSKEKKASKDSRNMTFKVKQQ